MPIAEFTFVGPEDVDYRVELSGEERGLEEVLVITYSVTRSESTSRTIINLNTSNGTFNITGLEASITPYIACLITCGLGHIVQETLDCWSSGNRTPAKVISCLRSKNIAITQTLVNCAVSCLGSLAGGGGSTQVPL
jgi:hypothetical protein